MGGFGAGFTLDYEDIFRTGGANQQYGSVMGDLESFSPEGKAKFNELYGLWKQNILGAPSELGAHWSAAQKSATEALKGMREAQQAQQWAQSPEGIQWLEHVAKQQETVQQPDHSRNPETGNTLDALYSTRQPDHSRNPEGTLDALYPYDAAARTHPTGGWSDTDPSAGGDLQGVQDQLGRMPSFINWDTYYNDEATRKQVNDEFLRETALVGIGQGPDRNANVDALSLAEWGGPTEDTVAPLSADTFTSSYDPNAYSSYQAEFAAPTDLTDAITTAYGNLSTEAETQLGGLTTQDMTGQIDTAYDALGATATEQLGGLQTQDFTDQIRALVELGRVDIRNLNAQQLAALQQGEARRMGQIGDIRGQLEGQLSQQERYRQDVQRVVAEQAAGRAGQMTADQAARIEAARGALGSQVTSEFEEVAALTGGLTGSQAQSTTAGMDRLAQVANQGAAQGLAAPAMLAAEAQMAVGDEKFRLENELAQQLATSMAELSAQEREQVFNEAMRQEQFGVERDRALANALTSIAQNRTGAQLTEQGRQEQFATERDRALANALMSIAQNRTGAQLTERGRQEQFATERDRALAETQLTISGQETAAGLNERQRLADIAQREGEIAQQQAFSSQEAANARDFAANQQAEDRRWQAIAQGQSQEFAAQQAADQRAWQQVQTENNMLFQRAVTADAQEFASAEAKLDRSLRRQESATRSRDAMLARMQDASQFRITTNLTRGAQMTAASQWQKEYDLAKDTYEDREAAELAETEKLVANAEMLAASTGYTVEEILAMPASQVQNLAATAVSAGLDAAEANKWETGSRDWLMEQGFDPAVATESIDYRYWNEMVDFYDDREAQGFNLTPDQVAKRKDFNDNITNFDTKHSHSSLGPSDFLINVQAAVHMAQQASPIYWNESMVTPNYHGFDYGGYTNSAPDMVNGQPLRAEGTGFYSEMGDNWEEPYAAVGTATSG